MYLTVAPLSVDEGGELAPPSMLLTGSPVVSFLPFNPFEFDSAMHYRCREEYEQLIGEFVSNASEKCGHWMYLTVECGG